MLRVRDDQKPRAHGVKKKKKGIIIIKKNHYFSCPDDEYSARTHVALQYTRIIIIITIIIHR